MSRSFPFDQGPPGLEGQMGPPGCRGPQVSIVQDKAADPNFSDCWDAASFTLLSVKRRRLMPFRVS